MPTGCQAPGTARGPGGGQGGPQGGSGCWSHIRAAPPQQPAARGAALEGNALTAMCCTLGLASLLFLCDFSGPFPFSGCFAVIPPALRPRFSPPSLKPLPSLFPSFPCSHSCRRTALPVPTKAEIAAKPSALQRLSAGGAAPVSPPSIAPTKTTQHRTHPPHPTPLPPAEGAARPEGLPRRLDPHLAFPPPPTHARSGAVPARSPLLPPRVPHRRPRRQRAGAELWVERRGEETEAESAASPPCHSEAGEPPPHAPPRPAQGCRARRGFISRLAQPTPQPREGAQPLGLHSPLRVPPSRAHTDPPFPSCLSHCSPLSPSHSWGPRAALPVPEPHALRMHIPLPTATQHCGASRNPQPRGSHCPLSAQESSWCPRRAAGGGDAGGGAAQKSPHPHFLHFTPSSSPGFRL